MFKYRRACNCLYLDISRSIQLLYGKNGYGWAPWHGPSQWENSKLEQIIMDADWTIRGVTLCALYNPPSIVYLNIQLNYIIQGIITDSRTYMYGLRYADCNTLTNSVFYNELNVPAYIYGAVNTLNSTIINLVIMSFCYGISPY